MSLKFKIGLVMGILPWGFLSTVRLELGILGLVVQFIGFGLVLSTVFSQGNKSNERNI